MKKTNTITGYFVMAIVMINVAVTAQTGPVTNVTTAGINSSSFMLKFDPPANKNYYISGYKIRMSSTSTFTSSVYDNTTSYNLFQQLDTNGRDGTQIYRVFVPESNRNWYFEIYPNSYPNEKKYVTAFGINSFKDPWHGDGVSKTTPVANVVYSKISPTELHLYFTDASWYLHGNTYSRKIQAYYPSAAVGGKTYGTAALYPVVYNIPWSPATAAYSYTRYEWGKAIFKNLVKGKTYTFYIKTTSTIASGTYTQVVPVTIKMPLARGADVSVKTGAVIETYDAEQLIHQKISLYPNPTTGLIKIQLLSDTEKIKQVQFINELGQTTLNTHSDDTSIDISSFSNGIYFYKIETNIGSYDGKIVKI